LGQLSFGTTPTWRSGVCKVSMELDTDSGINLDGLFAKAFATRFQRGIGKSNVNTLLSAATLGATATGSATNTGGVETGATTCGTDDLHALLSSLNEEYLASPKCYWAMRFKTYQALMSIKDKQGRPCLVEQYNTAGEPILLGKPVAYCPSMPAIGTGNKPIALGDFSRFIVRLAGDLRVQRQSERWIEQGLFGFEGFLRADAGLQVTSLPLASPPYSDSPIKYLQNA